MEGASPNADRNRSARNPQAVVCATSDCRARVELTGFPPNSTVSYIAIWGSADFGLEYRLAVFQDQVQTDCNGHAIVTTWFSIGKRMRRIRATVSSGEIDLDTGWSVWGCRIGRNG